MAALAMFPLGTVLFPGAILPLHVFEPRYRSLVQDCLAGEPEFGVVLIERGSEVGGGDLRSMIGTVARMVEVRELPDGRSVLVAVGTRRIRVTAWLDDDPYPRAEVEDWPDEPPTSGYGDRLESTVAHLRRVLALRAELGGSAAPATAELSDDPLVATYHAAALAPVGPADHYELLAAAGPEERLHLLDRLLDDAEEQARLELELPRAAGRSGETGGSD
jgi:Lon protease-like protein